MATGPELKTISIARVQSSKILIDALDWDGAAQMMGLALECALKAACCKTLSIPAYPEKHKDSEVPQFFMTHKFERLLLVAGLSEIFSAAGDIDEFRNWSDFVSQYPGDWVSMRYNDARYGPFDEQKTQMLYHSLYGDENHGIIRVLTNKQKW